MVRSKFFSAGGRLHYTDVNGALWTISYEFACYVAVALLGTVARRWFRATWLACTVFLLIGTCFIYELRALPQTNRFYADASVRMCAVFFAGGSLYLLGFRGSSSPAIIGTAGILFCFSLFSGRFNTLGFAIFGSVFFLSIGLRYARLPFTRNWPDISYGTYLYGWPVMQILLWQRLTSDPWILFLWSLVLSLLCGYLSWTLVEKRFIRIRSSVEH